MSHRFYLNESCTCEKSKGKIETVFNLLQGESTTNRSRKTENGKVMPAAVRESTDTFQDGKDIYQQ